VIGLSLAAAHIGFIVAFYMFGSKVGIWAPQDVNYSDAVNTSFPWIAGVAIGLMASTSEEFLFRLFAVPFIAKLTRSRVLAVILPAFSWSFLHSAYPQEPGYTRGIEVGIIGIVAGVVLLRWGIIATLIWHYTVDASLVGLLLIRSNSMYFKISGVIVGAAALAPLLFSGIYYLSRGKFANVDDLLNVAEPAPQITFARVPSDTVVAPKSSRRYQPLTTAMLAVLALCLVLGALLAWRVQPSSIGDYLKLSINARTAREHADEVIRLRGLDPASYYHATLLTNVTDPGTNEFLRERIGVKNLNEIYSTRVPGALWRVRYFRDSQPEEFNVVLRPDGSLHSVHHTMSEDAPGTLLTKEQAIIRAQEYLTREKHLDLSQWTLVESKSDKHPHRTDHTLTWQENRPLDAGSGSTGDAKSNAYARVELKVLGDEVSSYRTYIKIPDDWRRRQEELTLPRVLISIALPAVVLGGLTITVIILFLLHLRSEAAHSIPWRRIGLWGVWGLLAYILIFAFGNRIAAFLNAYQTAIPFKTMLETLAVGVVIGGPLYFSAIVLLFGMAWFFAREAFAEDQLPGWAGMPALYYRDALWIGLGGTAALVAIARIRDALSAHWPTLHRAVDSSFGGDYDATLPAADVLGTALFRGLAFTGIVVLIASFVASRVKNPFLRLLFFFAAALALVGTNWGTPADFLKQFVVRVAFMSVAYFGVKYLAGFNLLGIFLVIAGSSLLAAAAELLSQPDHFYRANGYALLVLLFLLLSWPLLAWRANPTPADT
jgi:membrane protease YdiL (CAAX protease family)